MHLQHLSVRRKHVATLLAGVLLSHWVALPRW